MTAPAGDTKREQRAWYAYDVANSAFMTSVVTVFLGPYLTSLARAASTAGYVYPLGIKVGVESYWPYLVSLSVLTQVIALPLFGAIADYGRKKREMLGGLAWLGAGATIALYGVGERSYIAGGALFLLANFAFGASIVIYNSFLPEIAAPAERDAVSSNGWGLGYLGGGILLALHLLLFAKAESWGISTGQAVRLALGSAGIWWALFTIIPVVTLKNRAARVAVPGGGNIAMAAFRQLGHTLKSLPKYPRTLLFLIAFLIYNDGIQTVITMAAQFGSEELKLGMQSLTTAILLTQFVALLGALLFNRIARVVGSRKAVMISLLIWCGTLFYVYRFVHTNVEFLVAAGVIGVVLGGSQALSRSIYSFMIPKGREAEYFSIYEISDKGTSWLGPLFLGLTLQWTGSFRFAIFSLILFFAIGLALLFFVDVRRAAAEAGNEPPPAG